MIKIDIGWKELVKSGETVFLVGAKGEDLGHETARTMGFGRYAPVQVGQYTIRRDGIVKSDKGDWTYQFRA
jgi:hypothetical protein